MVVLVNKYSASGSEILMGAFQDNNRATVIGEQTFGKGTVNVFRKLSNGGGLYMSVGRWYTPNKRPIEGEGLTPDILVTSRDSKEADIKQIDAAYEEINKLLND
jgi:carboxyl-terminal processing protease